jgi:hypothetical protein
MIREEYGKVVSMMMLIVSGCCVQLLYQAVWELVQGSKWNNNGWGLVFLYKIDGMVIFIFRYTMLATEDILPILCVVLSWYDSALFCHGMIRPY